MSTLQAPVSAAARQRLFVDDLAMTRRAREAGLAIHSLTARRQGAPGRRGLMMGFTNVRRQTEPDRLVAELMRALKASDA